LSNVMRSDMHGFYILVFKHLHLHMTETH